MRALPMLHSRSKLPLARFMRKEVFVAIFIGLFIGLIIVFGIITAQNALSQQQGENQQTATSSTELTNHTTPTPSGSTVDPATSKHIVTITTPKDLTVSTESGIMIKGTTTPNSHVALTTEQGEFVVDANETGQFSQTVQLIGGENTIHVVSFSPDLDRAETEITVIHTTAEF